MFYSCFFRSHGLCLFLYPAYEILLYRDSYENCVDWKCAADLEINFRILGAITVYPFMREIIAWMKDGVHMGLDFGISFGVILFDLRSRGWL